MNITLQQIRPIVRSVTDAHNQQGEWNLSNAPSDCYRLLYLLQGNIEISHGQKSATVSESSAFLFLPDIAYSIGILDAPVDMIYISFEMFAQAPEDNNGKIYRFLDQNILNSSTVLIPSTPTKRLLEGLLWEQQNERFPVQELLDQYLKLILLSLARDSKLLEEGEISNAAAKIMRYVHTHITENIQNDTIASELSYHPNYINRVIKKATGMTFHKYVVDEKLHYATSLLLTTKDSITDIAYSLSFNTSSHFSNLFAEKYHCTPSQYRKRNL